MIYKEKILFISDVICKENNGASKLSRAHLKSIDRIYGKENVKAYLLSGKNILDDERIESIISYKSKFEGVKNYLQLNTLLINDNIIRKIIKVVKEGRYDIVFVDNSMYGKLVKRLKKESNCKVIVFYHDIKRNLALQILKKRGLIYLPDFITSCYNERLSAKFADKNIVLNEREGQNFVRFYSKSPNAYLPIYMNKKSSLSQVKTRERDEKFKILFLGVKYGPNIEGIKWFLENVYCKLGNEFHLKIVGKKMDELKSELERKNVEVIGYVEDIDKCYEDADIVIGPIFSGAGMKVKTAEALKYGKVFLGTRESLEGYKKNIEAISDYVFECNTKEEFYSRLKMIINNTEKYKKYNKKVEQVFLDYYSDESAEKEMKKIMKY